MALESTIAGSWYPGKEREIRALADEWEKCVGGEKATGDANVPAKPNVLLLPHAGWAYSGEIAWLAVRLVRDADFRRVVVLAPSHRAWIENRLVACALFALRRAPSRATTAFMWRSIRRRSSIRSYSSCSRRASRSCRW